jgi:hypothetical protein
MAYIEPVKFTSTGNYGCGAADEDDVYTIEEFLKCVETGAFIDYDGFGHPVRDGLADPTIWIKPSRVKEIPADATHIVWYNR